MAQPLKLRGHVAFVQAPTRVGTDAAIEVVVGVKTGMVTVPLNVHEIVSLIGLLANALCPKAAGDGADG